MPTIEWINIHEQSTMVSYNPYDKRIYVYDHAYLLTVQAILHYRPRQKTTTLAMNTTATSRAP